MTHTVDKAALKETMDKFVSEWVALNVLKPNDIFVVGTSTSEVLGERIGTVGSMDVAEIIFTSLNALVDQTGVRLAFQCCEHLNRALVVEKTTLIAEGKRPVTVVPHRYAGGSMATYSYHHFDEAVIVETIEANAGIDIGETMIGMHLLPVAVPLRFKTKYLGEARLAGAYSRPKLIGGERAIYQ
ncbi:UPF0340 protein [Halolactibacillus alkaliphilus]|uniref:UPF0340 protein HAL01_21850 n=1 Tax=Halolactibacillus alkaliphilus TaxID=442899 RepID=A0A511X457_9BACI|nr:TIGR01440 family protein [Halolactibacillus alkaliphilus]GEN57721.1 UPF0340 protein [Halolactibacillus alkaliphilus]GGN73941.1 UPF0340 protein [Halolactibacillus alkaliphilus]SFO99285.1 TIGR01440 family protein [Halolactibacillus alkaliphilus]